MLLKYISKNINFELCNFLYIRQMPMTEGHTYQLSTAENELGVVIAHSEEGKLLKIILFFLLIIDNYVMLQVQL